MEGIIVGVDESSRAEAALRWAVRHGELVDEPVTALMAWGYLDQHQLDAAATFDPHYSADVAAKVLAALTARAVGPDAGVHEVTVNDLPARALLDAADGARLLVIGARSVNAARALTRDSVSRGVLHGATCPIAVVRDDADRHDAPVVVGLDGSAPSQRALRWALDLAALTGRRLIALHAAAEPAGAHRLLAPPLTAAELVAEAEELISEQLARVDTTGLREAVEHRAVPGSPIDALLDASATASIVVVGSRGRGAVSRAVLGSVSDRISHDASAPVVVVP
jgi:nucleotide-binding universal stress UspA family protein